MTGAAWKVAAGAAALGLLLSVHQIVMGIRLLPYVGWWTADLFFSVIRAMPPAARDLVFGMPRADYSLGRLGNLHSGSIRH